MGKELFYTKRNMVQRRSMPNGYRKKPDMIVSRRNMRMSNPFRNITKLF